MKLAILILQLFFLQNTFGEVIWTATPKASKVSCLLYRNRLSNYFQRISEINFASKVLNGDFTINEILNLTEVWKRSNIPLLIEEYATFSENKKIGDWTEILYNKNSNLIVKIESDSLKWETDKFIFPDEIVNAILDTENQTITFSYTLPYSEACLRIHDLKLLIFDLDNNKKLELNFKLDKYQWDKKNKI